MTTDYNQISREYQQAKEHEWRGRLEDPSFMKLIGDLKGKKVVDVACGEGHFTRRLRQAGAAQVMGFDLSARMIELAREQEARDPLGIDYRVEDARTVMPQQDYDLAVSAYLLVYAHDRDELARMCRGLASWLRPGGRLVTVTTNPDVYHFEPRADYRPYGFTLKLEDRVYEGAPIGITHYLAEGKTFGIENYYLPVSAYEEAFRAAGFRDFAVHHWALDPPPRSAEEAAFWRTLLETPVSIFIDCVRE